MYKYGVKLQTLWQLKKNSEEKLIHSEFHAALQIVTLFHIIFETLTDSDLFGNTDYISLQSFPPSSIFCKLIKLLEEIKVIQLLAQYLYYNQYLRLIGVEGPNYFIS